MTCVAAPAKLNLTLDVLGVRPDGYHELESIFASITLYDRLAVRSQGPAGRLGLITRGLTVPGGLDNICLRAASRLARGRPGLPGVDLVLTKRIPVASGLGGGSADAAATLVALDAHWDLGIDPDELRGIGAEVGADVPFCLKGGLALVGGKGELVQPLPRPPRPLWLVLVRPPGAKSTGLVYRSYDRLREEALPVHRPATAAAMRALAAGDWESLAGALGNVLEPALGDPRTALARALLEQAGALGAAMTGSGPTVFGIARSRDHARAVAARVARQLPRRGWWLGRAQLAPCGEELARG
ncbi:MAG: 4-(cytidine 5'-diphospho)-2-C-methyl-D-erythritol kinase [bacterium]|nr:4-(cytidine 5'-diphospho)-2-C-methyl-D-erythritol kinase [bacterium]